MLYLVQKGFKTTCGDVIECDTVLDRFQSHGDYIEFGRERPFKNESVYLNQDEIDKYLVEYHDSDYIDDIIFDSL